MRRGDCVVHRRSIWAESACKQQHGNIEWAPLHLWNLPRQKLDRLCARWPGQARWGGSLWLKLPSAGQCSDRRMGPRCSRCQSRPRRPVPGAQPPLPGQLPCALGQLLICNAKQIGAELELSCDRPHQQPITSLVSPYSSPTTHASSPQVRTARAAQQLNSSSLVSAAASSQPRLSVTVDAPLSRRITLHEDGPRGHKRHASPSSRRSANHPTATGTPGLAKGIGSGRPFVVLLRLFGSPTEVEREIIKRSGATDRMPSRICRQRVLFQHKDPPDRVHI
ncbi:hypothetical protein GGR56DRAFT_276548 [Xylariaceae sp. FL0804]|nr:hypothetical protein GGR56DRAFT_276548 [Xylariaceae sp. FL0804]